VSSPRSGDDCRLWIYYPHDEWLEESEFLDED